MKVVGERLAAENIIASVRGDRDVVITSVFSPHFYNTSSDLGLALELL